MANIGAYDAEIYGPAWFDPTAVQEGWFDYGLPFDHPLIIPQTATQEYKTYIEAFDYPQPQKRTRWKLEAPDLLPRDIPSTRVAAFSFDQRYGAKASYPPFADKQPPSVKQTTAFSFDQRYGGKNIYPPFAQVVTTPIPYSTKAQAFDLPGIQNRTWSKIESPDLAQEDIPVTRISAFSFDQRYGADYALPFADRQPPNVEKVTAFDLLQNLLGTRPYVGRRDLAPPSVIDVSAFTLPQNLLGTREYAITFPDLAPPNVEKVIAHTYDYRYGATYETFPTPIVVINYDYKTYVVAQNPPERTKTPAYILGVPDLPPPVDKWYVKAPSYDQRWGAQSILGYVDLNPAEVHKVAAFDLAQILLGTRPYQAYADLQPPNVEKITAFDYPQPYGATYKLYPTTAVTINYDYKTYVKAFDLAQQLLGTRPYRAYADFAPPETHKVTAHTYDYRYGAEPTFVVADNVPPETHKVTAVEILQFLLGPRAIRAYADFAPPETHKIVAHSYDYRYGGRAIPAYADYAPPETHKVVAHTYDYRYGAEAIAAYADLAPPQTTKVSAVEILQNFLGTRPYLAYADLAPAVYKAVAFDLAQYLLGPRALPAYADYAPPNVQKVSAIDYRPPYGATYETFPAPVTTVNYDYKTYVRAIDLAQNLLGTRPYRAYADFAPPELHKVTAHSYDYRYGGEAIVAYRDFAPPEIHKVTAHTYDYRYGAEGITIYPDLVPPEIHRIVAHTYDYRYGGEATLVTADFAPPETHKAIAVEILQYLLGTRAVPAYADYAPPEIHKITAHAYDYKYGARYITPGYADLAPPEIHRITAHTYDYRYGGQQIYPPFSLVAVNYYPPESHYVKQDIEPKQVLLGTRPYWKYADNVPPEIHKIVAHTFDYKYGGEAIPAYRDYAPPEVHNVEAFDLPQNLLGPRVKLDYADLSPSIYKAVAIDLLQNLLGTRPYAAYRDLAPPEIHKITAHTFDYRYGGQAFIPSLVTINYYPPEYHSVKAFTLPENMLGPRRYYNAYADLVGQVYKVIAHDPVQKITQPEGTVIYPDLAPPEIHKVIAFDLAQFLLGTRGYQGRRDAAPPEIHSITAFDLPQKLLLSRWIEGRTDVTAQVYRALGFTLPQKPQLPYFYVVRADRQAPEVHRIQAHDPLRTYGGRYVHFPLYALSTTWDLPWEARGIVASDYVLPWEALQGISTTGQLPYEVLFGLALTGELPWESITSVVPPHMYEGLLFAHYHGRLFRHYEGRIFSHLAGEPKKHLDAILYLYLTGRRPR